MLAARTAEVHRSQIRNVEMRRRDHGMEKIHRCGARDSRMLEVLLLDAHVEWYVSPPRMRQSGAGWGPGITKLKAAL